SSAKREILTRPCVAPRRPEAYRRWRSPAPPRGLGGARRGRRDRGGNMSAHRSPADVRAGLKHPIIDADGHWVEYAPVFAERMRKACGDKAADGFLASQRRIPDALSLTIEQRRQRGVAMEGYWSRQSTNTKDRATAMMPRLLYDRLDELGLDFAIIYPT